MAKLAWKYLVIPATSVASERMFSFSGSIITDKRHHLSDDVANDIVFCNYAMKCLLKSMIYLPTNTLYLDAA
ncbi:hypothetical protein BG000_000001 [Podila horticola]|nr:hypothetical protein BG000_000001 [Podila horticola]